MAVEIYLNVAQEAFGHWVRGGQRIRLLFTTVESGHLGTETPTEQ